MHDWSRRRWRNQSSNAWPSKKAVPADFDVAQINWKPDYDPFYYQHLLVRAERLYLFRDQYLFLLPSVLVAETPQAGHATYLFSRPDSLADFFRLYRATTREEILKNRNNAADRLGFLGRMVHGIDKQGWVDGLKTWLGEKTPRSVRRRGSARTKVMHSGHQIDNHNVATGLKVGCQCPQDGRADRRR